MSRWRQAFDRIGGPDAVTWPAFWITFFTSATANLTTGGAVGAPIWLRILILLVVQIAMFTPLVLLRFTLLRDPARPRPWVAIGGFVVAAITRGVVLAWLLVATGSAEEPLYEYRVVASLQSMVTMLVIVAVVVSTMRAHTRSLEALSAIQRELEATQARVVAEVTERSDEVLARVKARMVEEMTRLESADGPASVSELQRLASDVVRPMSHDLASALPAVEAPAESAGPRLRWQQVLGQMTSGAPLRPVLTAGLLFVFMITPSLGPLGARGFLLAVVLVASVLLMSWLANVGLVRLLPRLGATGSIFAILGAGAVVGFVSAGSLSVLIPDPDLARTFFVAGGIFVMVVALMIATVSAVLREQRVSERELAVRTHQLRLAVVRLRQVQWFQGKALSRALHGPVQAAVTAAALRLDAAVRSGESASDLLPDVRAELRAVVDVLDVGESTVALDEALARVVGTWAGLCTVKADVSEESGALLDADPVLTSTVVDLLTEAVSNAVRHGEASRVTVRLAVSADGLLELWVRDDGIGEAGEPRAGMGTRVLEDCALEWSRSVEPDGHVLRALLPTG